MNTISIFKVPLRLASISFLAAVLSLTALPAFAGPFTINTYASKNLYGTHSDSSSGSPAEISSVWDPTVDPGPGYAYAKASRTGLEVVSDAQGAPITQGMSASADAWSNYTLWDLGANAAAANGSTYTLSFNFHLFGNLTVPAVSLSTANISYSAVVYSNGYQATGTGYSKVYGPIAPFPSEGYVFTGDTSLDGTFDKSFSLVHNSSATGLFTLGLISGASGAGYSGASLVLDSVTLLGGTVPVGGLGIRIDQTGQIIQVTAVPEPETYAMLLAGLGIIGSMARRKKRAQNFV